MGKTKIPAAGRGLLLAAAVLQLTGVLDDRTLERVLTKERRKDLPGDPLKWEVALGNLLAQLRGDRAALQVP